MSVLSSFKAVVKKNKLLLKLYEFIFQQPIKNLYKTNFSHKVLLSYSTYHFKKESYAAHSNYQESHIIASIFNELGYQVDIVSNNRPTNLDLTSYQVIFGEGLPMFQALSSSTRAIKIYYGTGSHPSHCTTQSLERVVDFFHKYKFLALRSARTSDYRWGLAASMSDAIICIGNSHTAGTFSARGCKTVLTVDPSFHHRNDAISLGQAKDFSACRKSLLWFGSYGLLHKGLDLAVEAVRNRPDWTLHVCGYTPAEDDFLTNLVLPDNVNVHGFINVHSDDFKALALSCGFVILPSCSEGTATAVVTAVGNGAMVPLVTKECGYDVDEAGFLIELNSADIGRQLDRFDTFDAAKLREIAVTAQRLAIARYTIENYRAQIKQHISTIMNRVVS